MQLQNHEQVNFFHDPKTNLKAIIAIHSTELGPSLGGCRMMEYESEQNALYDVLRLSKGMTYKSAIAGLKLGEENLLFWEIQKQIKLMTYLKNLENLLIV